MARLERASAGGGARAPRSAHLVRRLDVARDGAIAAVRLRCPASSATCVANPGSQSSAGARRRRPVGAGSPRACLGRARGRAVRRGSARAAAAGSERVGCWSCVGGRNGAGSAASDPVTLTRAASAGEPLASGSWHGGLELARSPTGGGIAPKSVRVEGCRRRRRGRGDRRGRRRRGEPAAGSPSPARRVPRPGRPPSRGLTSPIGARRGRDLLDRRKSPPTEDRAGAPFGRATGMSGGRAAPGWQPAAGSSCAPPRSGDSVVWRAISAR